MFSLIKTKQKIQTYSQQYTAPSVNVELFESKFKYFSRIMLHTYFYYLPLVVKPVSTVLQYADELKQTQVIIIFSSLLIKIMVTWCGPSSDSSPILSLSLWTPSNCSASGHGEEPSARDSTVYQQLLFTWSWRKTLLEPGSETGRIPADPGCCSHPGPALQTPAAQTQVCAGIFDPTTRLKLWLQTLGWPILWSHFS